MNISKCCILWFLAPFLLLPVLHSAPPKPKSTPVKIIDYVAGDYMVSSRFLDVGATNYELRLKNIVKKSLPAITELFGGMPRNLNGCISPGVTLDFDTKSFHGEADPGWVEMGLDEGLWFGFITIENGLVHELFHLWNSETFRYKHRRDQWFSEGCTEYYAIKIAIKTGLIDKYDGVTRMVAPWGSYLGAHGIGKRSMRDMCETQPLKMQHYFLVYHGGYVVSMILDYDIRMTTKNEKSLDDLMRWLYLNFDRSKGQLYDMNDLLRGLKEITGKDYCDFFQRHVAGPDVIRIGDYIRRIEVEEVARGGIHKMDDLKRQILKEMFELD